MTSFMPESAWERLVLDELEDLAEHSWDVYKGIDIAPGSEGDHTRAAWDDLVLPSLLREAVARLNPDLPAAEVEAVVDKVSTPTSGDPFAENKRVHDFLTGGVKHTYTDDHGVTQTPTVHLIDERDPWSNDFRAVQQVMLRNAEHERRFDVVLYVNGMPLVFIELKKSSLNGEALAIAHAQLGVYRDEFPLAYRFNAVCVATDGTAARYGTAFTPLEHFAPWRVDDAGKPIPDRPRDANDTELVTLVHGLFNQQRFIAILSDYIAFTGGEKPTKRIAKPHQFFAVEEAVRCTIEAVRGDRKAGVVWHTQGSGKSFEMELYTARVAKEAALGNPTVVVLSDRTDLDDQLYNGFRVSELLSGVKRADSRVELREALANQGAGGVFFSTLQKFGMSKAEKEVSSKHPLLSERRNVVVVVDEAHRSHYNLEEGYAKWLRDALPNATMIAFTGTPISKDDQNTRQVFGEYIDIYDLTRAVEDGATVRVLFESRLPVVGFPEGFDPDQFDDEVDEATDGLDDAERVQLQQRVAAMNAVYGAPARLDAIADDLIAHWESRSEAMRPLVGGIGKAMVVCATREICGDLYDWIVARRPDWHDDAEDKGKIKVVFSETSAKDHENKKLKKHLRRPAGNKAVSNRVKNLEDELEILIVQAMYLTGFDAPPLHTMYLDRPIKGASLMQALARVNRCLNKKQDGLLVGYAPITDDLYKALAEYTDTDQEKKPVGAKLDVAKDAVRDQITVINAMLDGCPWREILTGGGAKPRLNAILKVADFLADPANADNADPKGEHEHKLPQRFRLAVQRLERFWVACKWDPDVADLQEEVGFYLTVRAHILREEADARKAAGKPVQPDIELYLKMLTASTIEADGVKDLYALAGVELPDLSSINEEYLARLRESQHPHLAIEALRRLIDQEIHTVLRHNLVRRIKFSEALENLMRRYMSQQITAAAMIAEMVKEIREIMAEKARGKKFDPPLNYAELAFYDAVCQNESAVEEMAQGVLADIARDLVKTLKRDLKTDWSVRSDVRAKMRSTIRRLLVKHGYPPDQQPSAVVRVIQQMETLADDWATGVDR
ncbi:type I restriction enzyme R subunit [Catenulispora sp. EB89]|uniref:type I restriction endonuclease subunit R n=1 Tax=Catenulispora sp. EB89 TaxID=3156257 RepID=UPI0035175264